MKNTDVFTNVETPSAALPKAEGLIFEALEKRYRTLLQLIWFGILGFVATINGTIQYLNDNAFDEITEGGLLPLVGALVFILIVAGFVVPHLIWWSKGFRLRTHDIHYKHGAIWRHVTSLPFSRIQHVELESGPLERFCKLTTLKFYSAGGGSADMSIPGLSFTVASKIRGVVMQHVGDNVTSKGESSVADKIND